MRSPERGTSLLSSTTLVTAALAGLLAIGTTVGVVKAVNSSSTDRVQTSNTDPVYGTR
jgi:hypothetical protein